MDVDGIEPEIAPAAPRSPTPPILGRNGRPMRLCRARRPYGDAPPPPPPVRPPDIELPPLPPTPEPQDDINPPPMNNLSYSTPKNSFGMYKIYPDIPSRDPDEDFDPYSLCDSTALQAPAAATAETIPFTSLFAPFLSATIALLMAWFYNGSNQKSVGELDKLVHEVILHDDFSKADLEGFSTKREHARLDMVPEDEDTAETPFSALQGWNSTTTVKIPLPAHKSKLSEDKAPLFEVKGLHFRPLLDVLKEAFQGADFKSFHTTPFQSLWDPSQNEDEDMPDLADISEDEDEEGDKWEEGPYFPRPSRPGHEHVYGEIYSSPAFLKAHSELPKDPMRPNIETIVAAYMFWSDSTHLANFGTASLWPLYTFFGNQSKYVRARPTSGAARHQAYIPSLPDDLADTYTLHHGKPPTPSMLTHLKRELMHGVWDILLSAEFIHAYVHGILVKCFDGIERLIFPRFFTYSADYPEK